MMEQRLIHYRAETLSKKKAVAANSKVDASKPTATAKGQTVNVISGGSRGYAAAAEEQNKKPVAQEPVAKAPSTPPPAPTTATNTNTGASYTGAAAERLIERQLANIQSQRDELNTKVQSGQITKDEYDRQNIQLNNEAARVNAGAQVQGETPVATDGGAPDPAAAPTEAPPPAAPTNWTNPETGKTYTGAAAARGAARDLRNNPVAKSNANNKKATEDAINNIKVTKEEPTYDSNGNMTGTQEVIDKEATAKAQEEARAAAEEKAAQDEAWANERNQEGEMTTPGQEGATMIDEGADADPLPEPNPDAFLQGLDAMEQQYAGTAMAPLFKFYKGQYAALAAKGLRGEQLMSAIQERTDKYIAQQRADMGAMNKAWTAMYDNIKQSQLESAQRTYDQQERLAQQSKRKDQMEYDRAIRDQNIRNEEDRQRLLLGNGVSGGWRSSMHTARMIDAFKKADNIIADLQNDKIFNSDSWDNKMIDIEQKFHENITAAYDAHNVNLLTLQDKLQARADNIDKTIYNNDINQLNAANKLVEDWFTGVAGIAENTTNAALTATKEAMAAAEKAKDELTKGEESVWDDVREIGALEDGPGKTMMWQALQNRAAKYGVTLTAEPPNIMQQDASARGQAAKQISALVGKDEYTHNGLDYGYMLAQSFSASKWSYDDVLKGAQSNKPMLDAGDFATVGHTILNNVRQGLYVGQLNELEMQEDLSRELRSASSRLTEVDPEWGGLWRKMIESGKPLADYAKDERYVNMNAHIQNVIGTLIHERFGAALTDNEWAIAEPYIVRPSDNAKTVQWKMQQMIGVAERATADRFDDVLGKGAYEKITGKKLPELNYTPSNKSPTGNDAIQQMNERWGIPMPAGGGETQAGVGSVFAGMGRVTQGYNTPVASKADGGLYDEDTVAAWGGKHAGLDVAIKSGTGIPLPFDGEVIESAFTPGWGGTVVIRDANGGEHRFSHLKDMPVKKGSKLRAGTVIGWSGGGNNDYGKGNSTGAHLDYRIRYNGQYVDPLSYKV